MTARPTPDRPPFPTERAATALLVALIAIEVCAVFETAMAVAAIPTFMKVFSADAATVGWSTTIYLLVGAASAATSGRLGDIFGRTRVLIAVLAVAALGSLISVLAGGLWLVVVGRGVQGMAAGALPLSFGLVRELLPERRVPLAMSLLGGVVPVCTGAGALLAGLLIDHSGWRAMFLVATVLGAAATVIAVFGLPRTPGITPRPTIDVVGGVLLAPAAGGVLFGATQGRTWGWDDPRVIAAFVLGVAAFLVWAWWERRVPEPMVDLRLFAARKVRLTTAATVMVGLGPMGAIAILSQMVLQLPEKAPVGLGLSPTRSGWLLLVVAVFGYGGAAVSGRIAQAVGARWPLVIGTCTYAAGIVLWIFLAKSVAGTLLCLTLTGIATGFAATALPVLIVEGVPAEHTGEATGINRVTQNIAVACGLALTSVILAASTVPGTELPTRSALVAALLSVTVLALVGTVIGLMIGGRRPRAAAEPAGGLGVEPAEA
ncbi:MFS transporter [Actinomadura sp. NTSP31]|uniref:MFS transporter n=1 Tax=Actinomadura sp. NTSP31 TaxID=1735447 RepID=UPI0035C24DE2